MGIINLGKVRGTQIYTGKKLTGTSAAGISASTGIAKAYQGDIYINTDTSDDENRGNVYECTEGGVATAAKWVYTGNIRGPKVKVIDSLTNTSTTDAVSANQARLLKLKDEKLESDVEALKGCNEIEGTIMDGGNYSRGNVYSILSGVKKIFYPITHAKAVWYSKNENRTVEDEIEDLKGKIGSNHFDAATSLESNKDVVIEAEGMVVISGIIDGVDQGIRLTVNGIRVFYAYGFDNNAGKIRYVHSFNVHKGDVVNGNATKAIVESGVTTPVLQFYPTGGR